MKVLNIRAYFAIALLASALSLAVPAAHAAAQSGEGATAATQTGGTQTGPSGLPLPRFVSLKSDRINVRAGPGQDHTISWIFSKAGLPVEIVAEYENWRRIRDNLCLVQPETLKEISLLIVNEGRCELPDADRWVRGDVFVAQTISTTRPIRV